MAAVISDCGRYRYRLERDLAMFGRIAAVIMVNPSTADALQDDATIRRVIGFGQRLGWSRVIVGNVFAYRATDIRLLSGIVDPVGPENAAHLRRICEDADLAIVAWGRLGKLPRKLQDGWRMVETIASDLGMVLHCLGTAADGHPRHPLMLSYGAALIEWRAPLAQ